MLANFGWPSLYFTQGLVRTGYIVVLSLPIEALAIMYGLKHREIKNNSKVKKNWTFADALYTAVLANAASLMFGILVVPSINLSTNAHDMTAFDVQKAFLYFWIPALLIEFGVIWIHRKIRSTSTFAVIALSNLATWFLMFAAPWLPTFDLG